MSIYKTLGVKTYINAMDTVSVYGGSRMPDAVIEAMRAASRDFVELEQLQEAVGARIAAMTHNEAALITAGASAGLLYSAAVCMAGADAERLRQLPDTTGLKNEIVLMEGQRTSFDKALEAAGARLVYVDAGVGCLDALRGAIGPRTAAVYFFDFSDAWTRSLSFEDTARVAREKGVPLIVDAAAQLPPVENLWRYTQGGAELAIFSGGKGLRGPQGSGIIVGKKWLIDGIRLICAPKHGIGRSQKMGREEIVGAYVALEEYLKPGAVEAKIEVIEARTKHIMAALSASGLFECERVYPGPTGQHYARPAARPLHCGVDALMAALKAGDPGVLVGRLRRDGKPDAIYINPLLLTDDEVPFVIDRVVQAARGLG